MPTHEVVVGVDPGLKGALVVMETASGQLLDKLPMPDDVITIYRFLYQVKNTFPSLIVACEKAQTLPGAQSVKGAFTSGRNFGALEAAIRLLYVPVQFIPPVTWQAELHKGADGAGPKDKSLSVAKNLWPWEKFTFSEKQIKPQDGMVDAMLVAEFLRRRIR
jgi:hypothetical protein